MKKNVLCEKGDEITRFDGSELVSTVPEAKIFCLDPPVGTSTCPTIENL